MDGIEMYTSGKMWFARRGEPACTDAAPSVGETSSRANRQCRSHLVGVSAANLFFFNLFEFLNLISFFRASESIRDFRDSDISFRKYISSIYNCVELFNARIFAIFILDICDKFLWLNIPGKKIYIYNYTYI